jgi:hypothetical protein
MRYDRGISQVNIYWNAIACHVVLQFKYLLRYCIVVCCIFYQLILHNIWYYKSLGIIWYCLLNIYLHIIIIYIYMCIYKFTLFESILLSILWAYHAVLLQTIRDHLIGYYGMLHGIVISTFIEVPNCIIFLLHGIIMDIA